MQLLWEILSTLEIFMCVCMWKINIYQFSSVTQSCPTLCDPVNFSTPGLPVHHQLPESTQTYVHRVSDAIQINHYVHIINFYNYYQLNYVTKKYICWNLNSHACEYDYFWNRGHCRCIQGKIGQGVLFGNRIFVDAIKERPM